MAWQIPLHLALNLRSFFCIKIGYSLSDRSGCLGRMKRMKPIIRIPTEGRTIAVVGDVYRFLATGEDTNGKYALWEAIVPPGGGPPPHVHSREEEGFYILEGEIR